MSIVLGGLVVGALAAVYRNHYKKLIIILFFSAGAVFVVFNLTVSHYIPYNFWVLAVTASVGSFLCAGKFRRLICMFFACSDFDDRVQSTVL
jgi:hypothetical protein